MIAPAPSDAPRHEAAHVPRLARGDIPSSWSQPAEAVSVAPASAPRPFAPTAAVLAGIAMCVVVAIAIANRGAPAAPRDDGARATPVATGPRPIDQVAEPAATASSAPTGVAPEDQGGADRPSEEARAADGAAELIDELPARKKAKSLVLRAEKLLLDGEAVDAEPLLRRAAALDPTYADAWRNLGIARATLGDTDGARNAYRRYLRLAPDAPDAREVRKILAESP